ncbi:hypothetical protein Tco_0654376 [Tanacetum coccineum]|uniref:Uncharacterized protein n=1 Tax=Tanacetum coccineum TaxID=301880 RepID=A0ABQ4X388_9ASTR
MSAFNSTPDTFQMFIISYCKVTVFIWVNERQIQTTEEKTDTSNALDASSVIIESNRTESKEQDTSSRSGNDAHVDDADIRPIYNEEPMAEVQTTAEINIFATGQQHTEQPEFNNEGKVDQNAEQCHDIRPLPAKLTDDKTIELSDQSLESENVCLKKIVAQFQKYFGKLEAHCINLELQLQMENNVLKSGQQSQFLKEKGLVLHQMTFDQNSSELGIHDHSNERSSSKLVPNVVPQADKRTTSRQELELLFHHHFAIC